MKERQGWDNSLKGQGVREGMVSRGRVGPLDSLVAKGQERGRRGWWWSGAQREEGNLWTHLQVECWDHGALESHMEVLGLGVAGPMSAGGPGGHRLPITLLLPLPCPAPHPREEREGKGPSPGPGPTVPAALAVEWKALPKRRRLERGTVLETEQPARTQARRRDRGAVAVLALAAGRRLCRRDF